MSQINNLEKIFKELKKELDTKKKKISLKVSILYSFNGTGKTRLSNRFFELNNDGRLKYEKALCYDAYLEDVFKWDNKKHILSFKNDLWFTKIIEEQGIQNNIIDNFKLFCQSKLEPSFNLDEKEVSFNIVSGTEESYKNIKISRGEERIFIWTVFYTILQTIVDTLNNKKNNRSTPIFNSLQYIIIDDPISSMDDTNIISITIELIKAIKTYDGDQLRFLIMTHHPLFYNILFNSFDKQKRISLNAHVLSSKNDDLTLEHKGDSPFGHHLFVKDLIQEAIDTENIQKYHFNLFRSLLEKTANFLGHKNWYDCLKGDKKQEFTRLINLYSHGKLSEMESKYFSEKDKMLFKEIFDDFNNEFKWKIKDVN